MQRASPEQVAADSASNPHIDAVVLQPMRLARTLRNRGSSNRRRTVSLLLALWMATGATSVQAEEAAVCLVKSDPVGGKLAFVARRADSGLLEAAGFQQVACPTSFDRAAAGIGARCVRLRRLDATTRDVIRQLFGLSPEAMCDVHDAWVRSR